LTRSVRSALLRSRRRARRLAQVPFHKIKIDQSFIADLGDECDAIIDAVANLGAGLDKIVVAEGIETEEQMKLVTSQGYHEGQGYLFGRPISARVSNRRCLGADGGLESRAGVCTYLKSRTEFTREMGALMGSPTLADPVKMKEVMTCYGLIPMPSTKRTLPIAAHQSGFMGTWPNSNDILR